MRGVRNEGAPHILERGLQSIENVVERCGRAFAGYEKRRRSDRLGVGARERSAALFDLPKQRPGVVAKHLLLRFRRPVPAARPDDHVDRGLERLVDLAQSNPFRRPGVEGPERNRWRRAGPSPISRSAASTPPGSTRTSARIR